MTEEETLIVDRARSYARAASEALRDQAEFFRHLPQSAEGSPTGCSKWDMKQLAGHSVGEAVWFPNLVRTVTGGAVEQPTELWEQLKALSFREMADDFQKGAQILLSAVQGASLENLQTPVDLGFTVVPLWRGLFVGLIEAVLHDWDAHVGVDPHWTIPTTWAQTLATGMVEFVPYVADKDTAAGAPATYLLDVSDDVGPVSVTAGSDGVHARWGNGQSDVTVHLDADQYVRLICGRFPLERAIDAGTVQVDGDPERALELNRIFSGIGN